MRKVGDRKLLASVSAACLVMLWSGAARAEMQTTVPGGEEVQSDAGEPAKPADVAAPAPADEPQGAEADTSTQLEDVVVYGQKSARTSTVQKTPMAITAVTGDLIEDIGAVDVLDVSRIAPNVSFTQASTLPGFANFIIRGVGVGNSIPSVDPAINLVVDGMVYDFQGATVLDAFDVETIEIMRGPQGTLFGKNATGGAVYMRTRRPTNSFTARGEVTVGTNDRLDVAGSVSGPLVDRTVLGKVAVLYRSRGGFIHDRNGGTFVPAPLNPSGVQPVTTKGTVDDNETLIIRPTFSFRPTSNFEFNVLGEYLKITGGGSASQTVLGYEAPLLTNFGYTPPHGEFENNANDPGDADIRSVRVVGEGILDVGVGQVTSITGYRKVNYDFQFDADGTPFNIMHFPDGNDNKSVQWSQEVRFASTFSDTVEFIAGAYYGDHDLDVQEVRLQGSALLGVLTPPGYARLFRGFYNQRSKSWAAFANVQVDLTPEFTIRGGGRYTVDKKRIDLIPFGACPGSFGQASSTLEELLALAPNLDTCPNVSTRLRDKWTDFSPSFGLEYRFTPRILAYANWSNGYRAGNYNGRATSVAAAGPADPEQVRSYEAGLKSTFWDGRARFNVAGFYSKYDDIQLSVRLGLVQTLANAASATIKGIEAEGVVRPIEHLEFSGSVGWTKANYDKFETPLPGLTVEQSESKKLVKVPEWTLFGSVAYDTYIPSIDTKLVARVSYSWADDTYLDAVNSPFALQKAHGFLDANLSFDRGPWKLTFFGRNLTKTHAVDQVNTIFVPTSFGAVGRTIGATLGFTL